MAVGQGDDGQGQGDGHKGDQDTKPHETRWEYVYGTYLSNLCCKRWDYFFIGEQKKIISYYPQ